MSHELVNENEGEGRIVVEVSKEAVPFDFGQFDTKTKANDGFDVEIMKADGESSGLFIRVLGQDSEIYNALMDKQNKQRTTKLAKLGRAAIKDLYDDSKENDMSLMVACTLGWTHVNGLPMPFDIGKDKENAMKFYRGYPMVYDQVRTAMADRSNFMKASAK